MLLFYFIQVGMIFVDGLVKHTVHTSDNIAD